MNMHSKTALITGASRGIGRAIALKLAQQGIKRLLLVARDKQRLRDLEKELAAFGVEVVSLAVDLTQPIDVQITIAKAWRDYGQIHLLINCAGVAYQSSFLQSQLHHMHEEIALNVMGMYNITRLIARRMAMYREGTIVNVSSLMGKIAAPTMSTYSATKFAIVGFTQALRSELAPYNIRVVALLPTLTDTDMSQNLQRFRGVKPMTSLQVAEALVLGLRREKAEILVGWQSHLAVWCQRLTPWLMERILQITSPPVSKKNWGIGELGN